MTDMEIEKQGYSAFERIMFFVTPILFTLVLLGVLLTLFNFDLRNKMLEIGSSIPLVKDVLPAPQTAPGEPDAEESRSAALSGKLSELESQLKEKETALAKAVEEKTAQEKTIASLKAENEQLKLSAETAKDEEYRAKVSELASIYSKMMPSKAAPILESMTEDEMALVLGAMAPNDRARVMEKMTPEIAADVTMKLKDAVTSKDLDIAALQSQLKQAQAQKTTASGAAAGGQPAKQPAVLDDAQLGATFSAMDAKSAGTLLVKMAAVSPSKVLRILKAVDDRTRSGILAEMSGADEKVTAELTAQLMAGK